MHFVHNTLSTKVIVVMWHRRRSLWWRFMTVYKDYMAQVVKNHSIIDESIVDNAARCSCITKTVKGSTRVRPQHHDKNTTQKLHLHVAIFVSRFTFKPREYVSITLTFSRSQSCSILRRSSSSSERKTPFPSTSLSISSSSTMFVSG